MQGFVDSLFDFLLRNLFKVQSEGDIVEYVKMRKQCIPLEYRVNMPLMSRNRQKIIPLEVNDTRIGSLESRDDTKCGRLAAAGRT